MHGAFKPSGRIKHEEGMGECITELESLMRGQHIGNSSGSSKISGSLSAIIVKTSIYGKERKSLVDLEIEKIKKAMGDFT